MLPEILEQKTEICAWKIIADIFKERKESKIISIDSICHECDGYNDSCLYYNTNKEGAAQRFLEYIRPRTKHNRPRTK